MIQAETSLYKRKSFQCSHGPVVDGLRSLRRSAHGCGNIKKGESSIKMTILNQLLWKTISRSFNHVDFYVY